MTRAPALWFLVAATAACSGETMTLPMDPADAGPLDALRDGGFAMVEGCAPAAGRIGATATLLPELGQVLIGGGARIENGTITFIRLLELYDPASHQTTVALELPAGAARMRHTASRLSDGRVLLAGGEGYANATRTSLASTLLIDAHDPQNVTTQVGRLVEARTDHAATVLPDGRVLVAGGRVLTSGATRPEDHVYLGSVEIFTPATQTFSPALDDAGAPLALTMARAGHSVTLLEGSNEILIAGGFNETGAVPTMELWRSNGQRFTRLVIGVSSVGPIHHIAVPAGPNRALLAGGYDTLALAEPPGGVPLSPNGIVEVWSFNGGVVGQDCTGALARPRGRATAVSAAGQVWIGYGLDTRGESLASIEVFDATSCVLAQAERSLCASRVDHAMVALDADFIAVLGGRSLSPADPFGSPAPDHVVIRR